jgi:uncharacterized protein
VAYLKPRKSKYKYRVGRSLAGLGLFATEEIPRFAFVIEYFGKFLSGDEAEYQGGKYLFEINKNLVVNGTTRKNIARYINHSCKPNCNVEIEGNRIFVNTKRKIYPGEELTYNYGKEYWEDIITPEKCKCDHCKKKAQTQKNCKEKSPHLAGFFYLL